jgi:hypothetical protein
MLRCAREFHAMLRCNIDMDGSLNAILRIHAPA